MQSHRPAAVSLLVRERKALVTGIEMSEKRKEGGRGTEGGSEGEWKGEREGEWKRGRERVRMA